MHGLLIALVVVFAAPAFGREDAQTILHLLDYIGVDYPEAVEGGKVKNADEYKEMQEFTAQVSARIRALPENAAQKKLIAEAVGLEKMVQDKMPAAEVAAASGKLRQALVAAYRLRLAPRAAPDLAKGKALYAKHCAACHGTDGKGDGPAAKGMEPAPSNFHDLERMAQRSAYGLYNTITLGVEGTGMASYKQLGEDERWALAFYAANVGIPAHRVKEGEKLWQGGAAKALDLEKIATLSTEEVKARHGDKAARVQDYLRAHPEVLKPAPLAFSRQKLSDALDAYKRGDRTAARQAAITGYLEGFELAEAALANVDAGLMREIERRMIELRASIEQGVAVEKLQAQMDAVDDLLSTAQGKLGEDGLSAGTAFTASLVILLREGLEAILVLAAIIAFVSKTGRRDALPWVHGGWSAALALGLITWAAAAFVVDISGAGRELTEGIAALLAAAMLLYVGWWLHGKSYAEAWTRFVREQVGQALAKRTLWAMGAVSFFAVYREMFEIVLFYQVLWAQAGESGRGAVLAGMGVAALALAAIGFAIFKTSIRLPTGPFFAATSALLALLAVVFTGHGIAALQEAGVLGMTTLNFEPIRLLGIYPSGEALAAQCVTIALVVLGAWSARRSAAAPA